MLKELKVRAFIYYCYYQGDENEILENGLGFMGTPDLVDFENQKIKYDTDWYENGWFELMENTGFKDSKENYIFDGDIVKDILGNIMKVEFKHFKWQLIPLNNTAFNMPMVDWLDLETETLNAEIIGNIFEKNNRNCEENFLTAEELKYISKDIFVFDFDLKIKERVTKRLNNVIEKHYVEKYGKNQ